MIYTITALLFLLLSLTLWNDTKKGIRILLFAVIWLILFEGFRWETGTDWSSYYDFFQNGENEHMGIAYSWLNAIIRRLTNSYTAITVIVAIITYSTLYTLYKKYSPAPIMSILIYYCSMIGILGSNRQILAMMICVGSVYFIFKRKQLLFLATVAIAVMFHVTALVFIPAYYLYEKKISSRVIILSVIGAFAISLLHLINHIPFVEYLAMMDSVSSGSTSLQSYLDNYTGSISAIGSMKRILFILLAVTVRERINNRYYDFFLILYATGTIIYLLFNGSVLQIMAGRGAAYYNIFESIVIPFVVLNFPVSKGNRQFLWVILFIMYFYLMWRDMNSFYILDGIDIYNPYKSVFI